MPVHYLASYGGGAEIQVAYLFNHLKIKGGYEIHFLCRRVSDKKVNGQKVWRVSPNSGLTKLGTFVDSINVYQTLKKISPHIVYQNVGCAYTGVAAFYAKRHSARFIWHIASDMDVDESLIAGVKNRVKDWVDRRFVTYGIRNADIIAAQTEYQNTLLKKRYGRNCDTFVPIGHPMPEETNKKSKRIKVLWVASVKPLKQPQIFIHLAESLGSMKNVEFFMMGHAIPGKWTEKIIKKIDSLPNLNYAGLVSQNEVNQRLAEGHILVNTSRYEGFSNTFIQAWLRSVPVVSLNVDPDGILERERIGLHSRTVTQLCADVRNLIGNSALRADMGERARKYACQHHTVEIMADSLITVFDSM